MKITSLFLVFAVAFASASVRAQKSPMKFGKMDDESLVTTCCPIDSNAHAYYIFDYGYSYFDYAEKTIRSNEAESGRKGFQLYFTRHFRIKILDNQGFEWGDIRIPLYHDDDEETITYLKATTYNLENGKVVESKLSKKDIKAEETSTYWNTTVFAMPNVKEGSVIEVEYTIKSDYLFNLREWYFQNSVPVLYSEYMVEIPEYFYYNQTQSGYYPVNVETDTKSKSLKITYIQKAEGLAVQEYTSDQEYNYIQNNYHYLAENIPAFPDEKYLKTKDNYLSKITFELNHTQFPNQIPTYYTLEWDDVDKNLIDNTLFGMELNKSGHLKDDIGNLDPQGEAGMSLLNKAFNLITSKMVWNGIRSKYVTTSLSKAYKDGSGNCADINLNLVVLLKELGFTSYPVILSTQDNGIIHPAHPSVSSFNYVIAMVVMDDQVYLMDATDPYSGINLLPIRCLNDRGRIIGDVADKWINLMDYKTFTSTSTCQIVLDENLTFVGNMQLNLSDYGAYEYRKEIKSCNDLSEFTSSMNDKNKNLNIEELEVKGLEDINDPLNISFKMLKNNSVQAAGNMIFFTPVLDPYFDENPFKLEKREFPVEFNYPYQIVQVYTISIPEGYEVSEIPEAMVAKLPDNSAKFMFQVTIAINSTSTKHWFPSDPPRVTSNTGIMKQSNLARMPPKSA